MTISEALTVTEKLMPGAATGEEKLRWLTELDRKIKAEILDAYGDGSVGEIGYGADTDPETELLVPSPYDSVYQYYIESRTELMHGEYERYNNTAKLFTAELGAFRNEYNRTHRHKSGRIKLY